MAPCSHPGQTQGREWWVSPRRLLSIGQPRTANPAGEHDTSAKKASLPGHSNLGTAPARAYGDLMKIEKSTAPR